MIKPLKKPVKKKKISSYRIKADKLFQIIFVSLNPYCECCGAPTSCGHHFFPKSMSSTLRYDFQNMIPVCHGCHFQHHNGNPILHATVIEVRGNEWLAELKHKKKLPVPKTNIKYYENIIKNLNLLK